ncbi:MAG TPA: DNA-binding response regulator [Deltaproteobacteria bacterium]|nr:DNA-binding response regulator [Deltaproteobacteria bacterium]
MSTRILLVEDHKIVREGFKSLLEKQPHLEVVGEAENGNQAVSLAKKLLPHVIIMDVTLPDMNGIEATRRILADLPGIKVVALSIHSDTKFVTEMLLAGARGYLVKDCAFEELVHAINAVTANRRYLSPMITDQFVETFLGQTAGDEVRVFPGLSGREREVFQLLAEGRTAKEIANDLSLSVKTVEAYRRRLMEKLGLQNVVELTKHAIKEGIVSLK